MNRKTFFIGIVSMLTTVALLNGCTEFDLYTSDYLYTWYVEGPMDKPSHAAELEAYLIELGAPKNKEGGLHSAFKRFEGNSETDANAQAKADFDALVARIDYTKIAEMGVSMEHRFTYSVNSLHGGNNVIAEWHYPNEQVDTVATETYLTIKMRFTKDMATYCNIDVLLNDAKEFTFTEEDTVVEKTYHVSVYPQDALFRADVRLKEGVEMPAEEQPLRLGCTYNYLLTNRNKAGEVVSSSSVAAWTEDNKFGLVNATGKHLTKWVDSYGGKEIVGFHIDGKNTQKGSTY